jgi:hypothetical protein
MSRLSFFSLVFLMACNASALIYGTDDRHEIFTSARATQIAKSTATMVSKNFILPQTAKSTFNLDFIQADVSYGLGLCKEEKYSTQPHGWLNCTGFLVAPDILVTAGHCMIYNHGGGQGIIENNVPASSMCDTFGWVFDFSLDPANALKASTTDIAPERIYSCAKVLYAEAMGEEQDPVTHEFNVPAGGRHGKDFAIIQLDRKVEGREPLKFAAVPPAVKERLMVVGYPSALPGKYAMGYRIAGEYDNYLNTDLDIAAGNSGSPVLNSKNEVTGIIVRGFPAEDYQYFPERNCSKEIICPKMGAGDCVAQRPNEVIGAHAQRASAISDKLKELGIK